MAYLALYRKYRPDNFDDVIGQEKVVKVISNAIVNNKVSHAYLFSGPRGTGKTTTAKIIAKMVNCLNLVDGKPCNECESCKNILNSSDVIEIDAASNNGVDEIREIRDKVNLVPSSCKYKIYIIDEVHMLTTQAFNALLKTLEEPPSHVIFILATTEFYKIPLTISSRCQKFQFTKIDDVDIVKCLKNVSKKEDILIEDDALYEIARLSDGGMRDAINLLDQLTSYQSRKIKIEDVYKVSGSVGYVDLYNLLLNVKNNNSKEIIKFVEEIDKNGKNINKFVEEIIIFLKDVLVYKNTNDVTNIKEKNDMIKSISDSFDDIIIYDFINEFNDLLIRMKSASYPTILLIVSLLKLSNSNFNNSVTVDRVVVEENSLKNNNIDKKKDNDVVDDVKINISYFDEKKVNIRINNALALAEKEKLNFIKDGWKNITNFMLNDKFSNVVGLLVDVNPVVASVDYIVLECKFAATADRLNSLDSIVSELFNEVYNVNYKVVFVSSERWNDVKNKYITDRKNGIVYKLINEDNNISDNVNNNSNVQKLVELLGEDLIEYK